MRRRTSPTFLLLLGVLTMLPGRLGAADHRLAAHDPEPHELPVSGAPLAWPLAATPAGMVAVPGGEFIFGSSERQKQLGYELDDRYTQYPPYASRKQRWYHYEASPSVQTIRPFTIERFPVTNAAFKRFVDATGLPAPDVSRTKWDEQGLIHPWDRVQRYRWKAGQPPAGRGDHPVVLADWALASAYCLWRGERFQQRHPKLAGQLRFRLPTGAEFERAARGRTGRPFPWGQRFKPGITNVVYYADGARHGPFDTVPVKAFPEDETPEGVRHLGGMVFEWTATPWHSNHIWQPGAAYDPRAADPILERARVAFRDEPATALDLLRHGDRRHEVRGGSWDDLPGITRGSARHSRPSDLNHILVGFRCAAVPRARRYP